MRLLKRGLLIENDVNFHPDTVTRMIGRDGLVTLNERAETPSKIEEPLELFIVDSDAR